MRIVLLQYMESEMTEDKFNRIIPGSVKSYPFAVSNEKRDIMSRLDYETSTDPDVVAVREWIEKRESETK